MNQLNEGIKGKINKKIILIIGVITTLIISIFAILIIYNLNNQNKKANVVIKTDRELGKEIYNELINIHENNIQICNIVYDGWLYSKSNRGMFSNTLYQQLERKYKIPFEFTLAYYNYTEKYKAEDTYGQIKILDEIDSKLENDMVFVILKYYENEKNDLTMSLNNVKESLRQMDNNFKYYDVLTDLYSNEMKLNEFMNNPKGTLLELSNIISDSTKQYDNNIAKLEIEFGN